MKGSRWLFAPAAQPAGVAHPARDVGMGGEPRAAQILRRLDQRLQYPDARSVANDEGVHDQLEHAALDRRGFQLAFED